MSYENPTRKGGPFDVLIQSAVVHVKEIEDGAITCPSFSREKIFSHDKIADWDVGDYWITLRYFNSEGEAVIFKLPRESAGPIYITSRRGVTRNTNMSK